LDDKCEQENNDNDYQHSPVNAHDSTPSVVIFCVAPQFRAFSAAPAAWRCWPESGQDDDLHFPTRMVSCQSSSAC